MDANETLHRFEQKLVPVRSIAAADAAFAKYAREMLPGEADQDHHLNVLVQQGWDAGYAAAMQAVAALLNELQTEALRSSESWASQIKKK